MNGKTWIIVDTPYLCWRAYHSMQNLRFGGISTSVAFGVMRDILSLRDLFQSKRFIFAFDRGPYIRADIYPPYKEKRRPTNEDEQERLDEVRKQIDRMERDVLFDLGFNNVFSMKGYEADDIIAAVVNHLVRNKRQKMIVVGQDHDLYQLLGDRVSIYQPRDGGSVVTRETFEEEWGLDPVMWRDVKAIAGCTSDNIEGVRGVGEKTAAKYLTGELTKGKKFDSIVMSNKIWQRNLKLVTLPLDGMPDFQIGPEKDEVTPKSWRTVCNRLGMKTIAGGWN